MQSAARFAVSIFLLTSALANAYQNSAKLRRDGVLNLYPFPRVGRTSHTWQVPLNDIYLEYKPAEKRQLYAFPRVGRNEFSLLRDPLHSEQFQPMPLRLEELLFGRPRTHAFAKRESESTDSTGMWFGPRLGRSFKSDEGEIAVQNENSDHSDPEQMEPEHSEDRKKRQTKQE